MLHKSISDHDLLLFDTDGTYFARATRAAIGQCLWHYAHTTAAQVPLYGEPSSRTQCDRTCSGSELPIANSVTGITIGTRKRCDPAFTAV